MISDRKPKDFIGIKMARGGGGKMIECKWVKSKVKTSDKLHWCIDILKANMQKA